MNYRKKLKRLEKRAQTIELWNDRKSVKKVTLIDPHDGTPIVVSEDIAELVQELWNMELNIGMCGQHETGWCFVEFVIVFSTNRVGFGGVTMKTKPGWI